ncbi:hypothetical protein ACS0TY_032220 [Phlomoides rotata]
MMLKFDEPLVAGIQSLPCPLQIKNDVIAAARTDVLHGQVSPFKLRSTLGSLLARDAKFCGEL